METSLKSILDQNVDGKRVIVRLDLDVDDDLTRIKAASETLQYLGVHAQQVIMIGHKGRPEGAIVEAESLKSLIPSLEEVVGSSVSFVPYHPFEQFDQVKELIQSSGKFVLLENLRFWAQEEANDPFFALKLASFGNYYVNEAFAVSHRAHASIVSLPKVLQHSAGARFIAECEALRMVRESTKRPRVVVMSGLKKDKLDYLKALCVFADTVLVAGKLPAYLQDGFFDPKVVIARLIPDQEDITIRSMEDFEKIISKAGTIFLAGPVGKYEDEGHLQGTQRVFTAVANSEAYKVAGGGDTLAALKKFGLEKSFDWISIGGGASLEYVAKGMLEGIEALLR